MNDLLIAQALARFIFPAVSVACARGASISIGPTVQETADPLFPASRETLSQDYQFGADGLSRLHWSNATPIRSILREAFSKET